MPYSVLVYIYRKEGTTPEQFKEHYETKHVPIIQRLSGDLFPTSHSRHYMAYAPQTESTSDSAGAYAPMVVQGQPADFGWDACTIATYTNETHFKQFMGALMKEENAKILADDEEVFMDRSRFKAVILGENLTTVNQSWSEKKA